MGGLGQLARSARVIVLPLEKSIDMSEFSRRHKFADWPNVEVPKIGAGVYAIWNGDQLVYCGMSGRGIENLDLASKKRYGLVTRLDSHASGRLSGDQFCVYVANRIVIPQLVPEQLEKFSSGALTLDILTKEYIRSRLEYQYANVGTSAEAFDLERRCRSGRDLRLQTSAQSLIGGDGSP